MRQTNKIAAVIQARLGSTRLPNKVLLDLTGKTILERVIERVKRSRFIDLTIVATTNKHEDLQIVNLCQKISVPVYRGSENDVLDRFYKAAKQFRIKHIVRITADCPVIDAKIIDQVIRLYLKTKADYATNFLLETFPDGEDVEVFSFHTLQKAWQLARLPSEREHVTPFIRNNPRIFHLQNLPHTPNISSLRWTIDEIKDYKFIREIYAVLYRKNPFFNMNDILRLLESEPRLQQINSGIIRNEGLLKSMQADTMSSLKRTKSQTIYQKSKKLIPGGTQLLSKRPEMFLPNQWPAYYSKAKGCDVWDLDGKKYTDMSYMGIGANILGYADPDVDNAVIDAIHKSNMATLNAPEEYTLAKLLIKLHPWAEMVRYTRSGGEAMAIAIRLARAYTGNDTVLFCGYHGWHDWYLAANLANTKALDGHLLPGLSPLGVPRGLLGSALPFSYNNTAEFSKKFQTHRKELAAVVMEPIRNEYPADGFLETIRKQTAKHNIPLIYDEITAGFRLCVGGAHLKLNVMPDMAVLGKGMTNGYPMAAVIGIKSIMQKAQDTFISSTYWTDRIGPVAALATVNKIKSHKVIRHLNSRGTQVQLGWTKIGRETGLNITVNGIPPLSHLSFNYQNSQAIKTLMTQEMLNRGYLSTTAFYASYAHTSKIVAQYLEGLAEVFPLLKSAIETDTVEKRLRGPIAHQGFTRLL